MLQSLKIRRKLSRMTQTRTRLLMPKARETKNEGREYCVYLKLNKT